MQQYVATNVRCYRRNKRAAPIRSGANCSCRQCVGDEETNWPEFLERARTRGIVGITNFPTVGFIDGTFRERPEDIPLLVQELAQEFSQIYGCAVPRIPDSVMQAFVAHTWPGNIREVRNVLERGFILGRGRNFSPTWLSEMFALDSLVISAHGNPDSQMIKRARLTQVLTKNNGNKIAAARELGISRRTIYDWLESANR